MDQPTQGVEAPQATANKKIFLLGFLGLVAAAILIAGGVGIYRVYAQTATDSYTLGVAKLLNLPAAKVNGMPIAYTDYVADLKAISMFRDYSRANAGAGAELTDEQMSDQVLLRMANNVLVAAKAKKLDVVVTQSDIDGLKAQALAQFKTTTEVDQELMKRYGWDLATYEAKVMRPYLLQSKLAEKIQSDPEAVAKIRNTAQGVLDQIKERADFTKLAEQYGEDGTASNGGDLGWVGKGEMVPQFEAAVFALKKGEVTQTLVETPYGFHIIKVEDRKVEKTKDTAGKTVEKEMVQARHILFRFPSIEKYLDDQMKSAQVRVYIKVHDPFPGLVKK